MSEQEEFGVHDFGDCMDDLQAMAKVFDGMPMGKVTALMATFLAIQGRDFSDGAFFSMAYSFGLTLENARDRVRVTDIVTGGGKGQ